MEKAEHIQSSEWDRPQSSRTNTCPGASGEEEPRAPGSPGADARQDQGVPSACHLEGTNTSGLAGQMGWHRNGGSKSGPWSIGVNSVELLSVDLRGKHHGILSSF